MKIEVTVTKKSEVDADIAVKIAEGFLEFLDSKGLIRGLAGSTGPSYEELANSYIAAIEHEDPAIPSGFVTWYNPA